MPAGSRFGADVLQFCCSVVFRISRRFTGNEFLPMTRFTAPRFVRLIGSTGRPSEATASVALPVSSLHRIGGTLKVKRPNSARFCQIRRTRLRVSTGNLLRNQRFADRGCYVVIYCAISVYRLFIQLRDRSVIHRGRRIGPLRFTAKRFVRLIGPVGSSQREGPLTPIRPVRFAASAALPERRV